MNVASAMLTGCVCAIVVAIYPCKAVAQRTPAAIVEEIQGATFWRKNANARKVKKLDPESDAARPLYAGEQVLCRRGSILRLRLGEGEPTQIPARGWFTIKQSSSSRPDPFKIMLKHYAYPTGRDRTGAIQVFSPADHSVTVPQPFIIQWTPSAAGCVFSLTIQDAVHRTVWQNHEVDGALGSLQDTSAEQSLIEYRTRGGQGPLTLIVNDSCGSTTQLNFSLLNIREELSLKNDLDIWNKQTGTFTTHLGRASVYDNYRMLSQAAEEYEAALKQAPRSHHLLIRTIAAQRATGNFIRAGELKKRLPVGAIP